MKRHVLGATALALALTLTGQAGVEADDQQDATDGPSPTATNGPEPTPTSDPSPAETTSPTPSPAPNQPPVAVDDAATVSAGRAVEVDVLANDTDDGIGRPDGTPGHLEVVGLDAGRRFSLTADAVVFRSEAEDRGEYSATYRVSDGDLESTARVTVDVRAPAVARRVSIHLPRPVLAPHRYRVRGVVGPVSPRPVRVRVQRRTGSHWVRFARVRTDARGRYAAAFRPLRTKRIVLRAVADWPDGRHARSDRVARRVRARPEVRVSGPLHRRQLPYSWRVGCPVPPRDLRSISINRFDYGHRVRRGTVVVAEDQVTDVVDVLKGAFRARFPIRRMRPADHFYAGGSRTPEQSDVASMRSGNTSAFNCRPVTGNPYRVSQHSYGNAIDINTVRNPYVTAGRVYPGVGRPYLDRSRYRPGMILRRGVVAETMAGHGWPWGARWAHPDYQHFSSNGG